MINEQRSIWGSKLFTAVEDMTNTDHPFIDGVAYMIHAEINRRVSEDPHYGEPYLPQYLARHLLDEALEAFRRHGQDGPFAWEK